LAIAAGGYTFFLWNSVKETADKMHDNATLKNHLAPALTNSHPQPISILLLGVDERKNDVGRSDTSMVLTLNPEKKNMQMVSIP
jgi:anionic cell wall polymer biosynthesis LytR-Cps2A-Psr (LCP) family protein